MKNLAVLVVIFFCDLYSYGQELNKGVGVGYQLSQYQQDFGFGISASTPYFLKDKLAFRLKTNMMYHQNVLEENTIWIKYSNASFGLIGVSGMINEKIRLYGEGGIIGIFPSSKMSSQKAYFGGYGLFGFEFFFTNSGNYFIEIGGVGSEATANEIATRPIFSNGLTISTGIRFFFNKNKSKD